MSHNRPLVIVPAAATSSLTPEQRAQEQAMLAWLAAQVAEAMTAYRE